MSQINFHAQCIVLFFVCFSIRLWWYYVVIFFNPSHIGQWPWTFEISHLRCYPLLLLSCLKERASISLLMMSAKQGNFWYHFYIVFGMTWSCIGDWAMDLQHLKPALYHQAIEVYSCNLLTIVIVEKPFPMKSLLLEGHQFLWF